MWQHHFEFLLLGYGAYMTFSELCKSQLPDIPDQHVAQMIAGIDVLLFKPERGAPKAGEARDRQRRRRRVRRGAPAGRDRGRARRERGRGRSWLEALEQIKDPWFNMATGDGLYHFYRSWYDDPSIAYASLVGHVARTAGRRGRRAPAGRDRARARPPRRGVPEPARRAARAPASTSCSPSPARCSRTSRSTSSSATTGSSRAGGTRCASSARCSRARLPRGRRGRVPAHPARGRAGARRARASRGRRAARRRAGALAADRRSPQGAPRAARRLGAASCDRCHPGGDHRSRGDHALGRDDAARAGVGERRAGRRTAHRRGGVPRRRRGRRPAW